VAEGHVIGNHSWSHPNLAEIPIAQVREELVRTSSLLEQITRTKIRFFRPPYGACNPEVLSVARTLGMLPVFWNAIAADWEEGRSASQVSEDLSQQIDRNRRRLLASCIVLHDGRAENPQADCSESVQSAAQLIGRLQENYRFVSIQSW
jgi:peptidoglycan/xylan/chitin deacetylase (PgdA/CDA1 family)